MMYYLSRNVNPIARRVSPSKVACHSDQLLGGFHPTARPHPLLNSLTWAIAIIENIMIQLTKWLIKLATQTQIGSLAPLAQYRL